jgi:hypothetical protein
VNQSLISNSTFNYSFPISFSSTITTKDKLTYWIYTEETPGSNSDEPEYNNIGDAFGLDFISASSNLQEVKKILDFLKPDYLIFKYITLYTKNLYGL